MPTTQPRDPRAGDQPAPTRWYRSPWFWAFIAGAMTITLLRPYCKRRTSHVAKPPPVVAKLPTFRLLNQHGALFGTKELEGKVWVANFIFTSCRSICPRLTSQMRRLQTRFSKAKLDIRLVSISVDPEVDTPKVLLAYAQKNGVDLKRWTFLTGPRAKVQKTIEAGFRTHMGDKVKDGAGLIDIAHTGRFVLVDRKLNIRGFYRSDDSGISEVFARAKLVYKTKP